jgi:phage terminase small subunit
MSKSKKLTERQKLFVKEYLVDLNASAAAKRAGYSPKTHRTLGMVQMRNPLVRAEIDAALAERAKRVQLDGDFVVQRLMKIADLDIRSLFDPATGRLRPVSELSEEVGQALSSVDVWQKKSLEGVPEDVVRVRGHDKIRALELLSRHLGIAEKVQQVTTSEKPLTDYTEEELVRRLMDAKRRRETGGRLRWDDETSSTTVSGGEDEERSSGAVVPLNPFGKRLN